METTQIKNVLESLLLVARKPLSLEELEQATTVPQNLLASCLEELIQEFQARGIRVIKIAGGYQLGTNPDNVEFVQKLLHPKVETKLSTQALETLAVIAYKQPVTRAEIERLRGVTSDWVIDTLLAKKLVRELGRSEAVGRPYLYGTTDEFLKHFGLKDRASLPPLPASEVEQEIVFKSALHESTP